MNNQNKFKRGPGFVLGLGTRVIPDQKKKENKNSCRKFRGD
jgi:hypothetical protein